jgi:hypothetical protein
MTIPVRVISLKRLSDRRAAIAAHLAGLGLVPEFFEGVDGRLMSAEDRAGMRPGKNPMFGVALNPSQIAVGATYRLLCLEIAAGPDPFVCILEDDAVLAPRVVRLLDEGYLSSLPPFDVLRFGHAGMRWRLGVEVADENGFKVVAPLLPQGLCHGQIVSREGAARIAAGLIPLQGAIDIHLFNGGYVRGLRVLHTIPRLAEVTGVTSTVAPIAADQAAPRPAERLSIRWARAMAIARCVASYATAWGPAAPLLALVRARRPSWRQARSY